MQHESPAYELLLGSNASQHSPNFLTFTSKRHRVDAAVSQQLTGDSLWTYDWKFTLDHFVAPQLGGNKDLFTMT